MWLVGAILISFLPVGLLFYLLMQRLKDKDGKIRRSLFVKYSVGIFVPALIIFLIVVRMPLRDAVLIAFPTGIAILIGAYLYTIIPPGSKRYK